MYKNSSLDKNIFRGEKMKKRLKLKPFVLPTLYIMLIVSIMMLSISTLYKPKPKEQKDLNTTEEEVFDTIIPVVNAEDVYVKDPFSGDNIEETIGYYNYLADKDSQEKSIIKYDKTYLQNTGITYSSENEFNIVSILDGEVTKIYSNDILGNVIEITHDNNLISVYQMVNSIKVKEGDKVQIGQTIATSGTSKISTKGHNLHFEIIKDGTNKDPKTIIGLNTKDL